VCAHNTYFDICIYVQVSLRFSQKTSAKSAVIDINIYMFIYVHIAEERFYVYMNTLIYICMCCVDSALRRQAWERVVHHKKPGLGHVWHTLSICVCVHT